jgi:hypothetical protein
MHLSSSPCMPHALPISVFMTWSPEWCLVRSTEHKALCYAVFSTPLLPHPSWAQISSSQWRNTRSSPFGTSSRVDHCLHAPPQLHAKCLHGSVQARVQHYYCAGNSVLQLLLHALHGLWSCLRCRTKLWRTKHHCVNYSVLRLIHILQDTCSLFYLTTVASHFPSPRLTYKTCWKWVNNICVRCEPKTYTSNILFKYGESKSNTNCNTQQIKCVQPDSRKYNSDCGWAACNHAERSEWIYVRAITKRFTRIT